MTSNKPEEEPLDLNLFDEDDDEDETTHKKLFDSLVSGELSPSAAAVAYDAWIVESSNARHERLLQRADPYNLTPEEESQGLTLRGINPNASGCIESSFRTLASLCSSFPPHHPTQDRIIQFLEALRQLPEHRVPDEINDDKDDRYITLWPFGDDWDFDIAETFRRPVDDLSYPYSDIETLDHEVRYRWQNLQSAMARITAAGLIDFSPLCALDFILPSSRHYPDLAQRKLQGPKRISGDAIAGAQWVLREDEGRYVYRQCKRVEKVHTPGEMWSLERWEEWKKQFAFIAGDERFDARSQSVARLAREQMISYEEENGVKPAGEF